MYTEIVFECERSIAENFSDALVQCGALAASIEDALAGTQDEEPVYGEPGMLIESAAWAHNRVSALFAQGADTAAIISAAELQAGIEQPLHQSHRLVAEEDWVRLTQSQFEPIEISSRIFIVPSWHTAPKHAASDAVLIELDPGLAFGTGSHPTTRLCLEWLDLAGLEGQSVIDYGCGSGILAIAASRLGAAHVSATDIDPMALNATRSNAATNQVTLDVFDATSMPALNADVVIANILSNPLKVLAPLLASLVKPGGRLTVSGVLERQIDEVALVYRDLLPLQAWRIRDGWACMTGRRAP
jgi:ribosomal protein L11 methyltransferase